LTTADDFLRYHPNRVPPVPGRAREVRMEDGDEPLPFDWAALVPFFVHPVRVSIVEAMRWIGRPLSPSDLKHVFDDESSVSFVSYHVRELTRVGALKKVRTRQVRGAMESFYFFPPQK
jgi:hypothetical protein